MPENLLSLDWNLDEPVHPNRLGAAGIAAAAIAGAAFAATRGPAATTGVAIPLLGMAAAWLRSVGRTVPPDSVESFLRVLERRDRYTARHCSRVAGIADLIAEEIGFQDPRRLRHLRVAALLHDLGKLDVPLDILHKPGALDEDEWEAMRGHVLAGARRASGLRRAVCRIIAQHHERPDGRGYPRRLRGAQICLEARIVAVADAFDAMTSDRPYRDALSADEALAELLRSSDGGPRGEQFDPAVVGALQRCFGEARTLCARQTAVCQPTAA